MDGRFAFVLPDVRGIMRGRINVIVVKRAFDDQPARVFHHAALGLVVAHQRREHRETRRVAGSPARRSQPVGVQIEHRAVGRLPVGAHQLRRHVSQMNPRPAAP